MSDDQKPTPLALQLRDFLGSVPDPIFWIDWARELYEQTLEGPASDADEERAAERRGRELMRALAKQRVATKLEPTLRGQKVLFEGAEWEFTLEMLDRAIQDEELDECFTLDALSAVPGIVSRWKKLKELLVDLLPDNRVMGYLRQATTCYLYGLPDATAVLCRAAIEAALTDKLGSLGGTLLADLKLAGLIDLAQKTSVLTTDMAGKAHRIRKVGRDAIHNVGCSEPEARVQIRETAEALQHIYGRTGR